MDKIFKSLADKNRRKILTLLKEKDYSVNELLNNFNISQATLSNHLSILRKADLVNYRVAGKQRIYGININLITAFVNSMSQFVGVQKNHLPEDISVRGKE